MFHDDGTDMARGNYTLGILSNLYPNKTHVVDAQQKNSKKVSDITLVFILFLYIKIFEMG